MATWSKSSPQIREFRVAAGAVQVVYAENKVQLREIRREIRLWEKSIGSHPGPLQRDGLELAKYSIRRWEEAYAVQRTALSVERLKQMIVDHQTQEVRVLAVARAVWLKAHRIVGLCTFRRTWCNHIALDALVVHPVLDSRKKSPINLLGTGLIHHVCSVAESINAPAIWGECTQNSLKFYGLFIEQPERFQDLISLPPSEYRLVTEKAGKKLLEAERKL